MLTQRFIVGLLQDTLVLQMISQGKTVSFKTVHELLLQLSSTSVYVPFDLRYGRNGL